MEGFKDYNSFSDFALGLELLVVMVMVVVAMVM